MDRDEAGAEAFDAGEILVAGGLVDRAFAAECGFDRDDGDAVGGFRAVAAAFADALVDEGAFGGVDHGAAFAAAAFFGGTGLIVDEDGDARGFAQGALERIERAAVVDGDAGGEVGDAQVFFRLVGDDVDSRRAFGLHLAGDLGDAERAVDVLAAGHRHGVVEQDAVGDVGFGGDSGADREAAGVVVGAVAKIGEDVLFGGEGRLADPGDAFAAHLAEHVGFAVHPGDHVMAADAGHGA